MTIRRTLLLGLLALPLAAQSSPFSVGGGLILGLDSYKKAVNSTTGFTLNGGWETSVVKSGIPARVSLGVGLMPGKEASGLKTSLTVFQLSGDLLIDTGMAHLRGVAGLSVNKYSARFSGQESASLFDAEHHFPFHDASGLKGGIRLGLEYAATPRTTVELLFQSTELAGRQRNDALIRKGAVNPGWLQVGARYRL